MRDDTISGFIMHVNNEIGVVHITARIIGEMCRARGIWTTLTPPRAGNRLSTRSQLKVDSDVLLRS